MKAAVLCFSLGLLTVATVFATNQELLSAAVSVNSFDLLNSPAGNLGNGSVELVSAGGPVWQYGSSKPSRDTLKEICDENDWKNDLVLWVFPAHVRSRIPRLVQVTFCGVPDLLHPCDCRIYGFFLHLLLFIHPIAM